MTLVAPRSIIALSWLQKRQRPRYAGAATNLLCPLSLDILAPARGGGLDEPAVTERVVNTILVETGGPEDRGAWSSWRRPTGPTSSMPHF